MWSGIPNG